MPLETCMALSAIFPLIFVTCVLERRNAHMRIRRHRVYRRANFAAFSFALIGTVYAVIGVQLRGFEVVHAVVVWGVFAVAMCGLTLTLLASVATAEIEEEKKRKG